VDGRADAGRAWAGGSLTFSHEETGIGVATSGSPDFAARAARLGKFSAVTPDMIVQWQQPITAGVIEEAGFPLKSLSRLERPMGSKGGARP